MGGTGPSLHIRELVISRGGGVCERCGKTLTAGDYSLHHRKPRGMGGTSDPAINSPANLLGICGSGTTGCHGWIESHRADAYEAGWLVHREADPEQVPVRISGAGTLLLTKEGTYAFAVI